MTLRHSLLWQLLKTYSWAELRHHPWRNAAAVLAVTLGVALAFAVHLINASALDEFSQAVRSVNGEPDVSLRAAQGSFDEGVYARVNPLPQVAHVSPVLEISTYLVNSATGSRSAMRVLGVDALVVAPLAPDLMPQPSRAQDDRSEPGDADRNTDRFAIFAPNTGFLNAAAKALAGAAPSEIRLQSGMALQTIKVAGTVNASGAALVVMDLGAAQDLFNQGGKLSRIDINLTAGTDRDGFIRSLSATPGWPADVVAVAPGDSAARISNLSRAYRVNLTVLALVALFTGAFLVFSVLSLSVAKRAQQFALLGVLGLTGHERLRLVLLESGVLGLIGSVMGIALGTALAALSLQTLGGDLGGGYFSNVAPALRWSAGAALIYGALGLAAAGAGGWWPARQAQRLPPAQTLKGLGQAARTGNGHWLSLGLIALGVVLARAPAVFEIPLAAYVSVGLLLIGGITALPWFIALLLDRAKPMVTTQLLPLLALERARRVRESASVAVSGVVASLSLAVALTVMVASFRDSVTQWLNVVLPADLYVRTASSRSAGDTVFFTPEFVQSAGQVLGVKRLSTQRTRQLQLDPTRPAATLIARPLADPARNLPLVGEVRSAPSGSIAVFVSEAIVDLYGVRAGDPFTALSGALTDTQKAQRASFFVAGVLRDYAGQAGSITIHQDDYQRLTNDARINDIALWLDEGADTATVQQALREVAGDKAGGLLEFASSLDIRAQSLKIFDRSFAITYWLQAVAIGIGLFGVAASFSAQVLARRKEFGLLVHLGLTRQQILGVVAGEGLAWTATGALAGLALGLAVSVILVHVVNPQSFHWTMDMAVPWPRLALLCVAVVVAGTLTAWASARAAAGRDAVLAVKEDW
jgi:putative ABC transport system permease protein